MQKSRSATRSSIRREEKDRGLAFIGFMGFFVLEHLAVYSRRSKHEKVCEEIASSISTAPPIQLDLARAKVTENHNFKADVWVLGIPVYASRMPSLARKRLNLALCLVPKETPAIAVTVYGNVDVGVELEQLVDLLSDKGLNVVGAGEFIGEHYFKKFHKMKAIKTTGRPNKEDLAVARELGTAALKKGFDQLGKASMGAIQSAKVPLRLKFTGEKRLLGLLGPSAVDPNKCTKCHACIKACPQ